MSTPKVSLPNPVLSPLSIARVLWKHKYSLGILWASISMIGFAVVHRMPAIYASEAMILVDSQKIPEKYVSSTVSTDLQDRIQTISQQILSSTQLKKVIDEFDLYHAQRKKLFEEEILETMRKDITINLERGWTGNRPGAFRIGYQGPNPSVVAQVANRLADLYIDENLKTREVQAEGTSEFISMQLQEAKKKLDELESAVSQYKLAHNGELPQQEGTLNGTLSRLQTELEANRDAINRAEQTKLFLENTLNTLDSTASALPGSERQDPVRGSQADGSPSSAAASGDQRPKSEILQAQLDLMRLRYSDQYPDVKRLTDEVARLKDLEQKEGAIPAAPAAAAAGKDDPAKTQKVSADAPQHVVRERPEARQARERINGLKSQMALINRELEVRTNDQQRILRDIAQYQARIVKLPVREQEMAQVTRDYEISKANYRSLLDKQLSAEMSTDMERRQKSERFTLLDPARVPEKPVKPNRPLLYALGSLSGLVVGLAFGLGRELKQDVVLGEWELPPGIPVLGRLPYLEISATDEPKPAQPKRKRLLNRKLRLAMLSSAVLSLLGLMGAGVYFIWYRG
jgi:polysaccharide biosynthesis transport protein